MKRFVLLVVLVFADASATDALTYPMSPTPANLWNLDHKKNYTWGIDWNVPEGQKITGAKLTFADIWDWKVEEDYLYIHLLDTAKLGVRTSNDNEGGGDYFESTAYKNKNINHLEIATWSDPLGGSKANAIDLVYNFDAAQLEVLRSYISTSGRNATWGNFGFGFDPDCHYWNKGITFEITTQNVPESASTALLMSLTLASCAALRRKFST